jgi:hypothetical protein
MFGKLFGNRDGQPNRQVAKQQNRRKNQQHNRSETKTVRIIFPIVFAMKAPVNGQSLFTLWYDDLEDFSDQIGDADFENVTTVLQDYYENWFIFPAATINAIVIPSSNKSPYYPKELK